VSLAGRVALVTGGGTGIGAAIARRFANEGASVVLVGRRLGPLEETAEATGALAVAADVRDRASVQEAVTRAVDRFGGLDVVVNNAGVASTSWSETLEVNLTGAYNVAEETIPRLLERGGGAIVNVSSIAGLVGGPGSGAYSSSKAGVIALTRALAVTYGAQGVRANALCPGWVRTPMSRDEMEELARIRGVGVEAAHDLAVEHLPLRRFGEPEEIAAACLFLASPESSFVTGAVLVADGGSTAVDVGLLAWPRT